MTSEWAPGWRLKSPASRLLTQRLFRCRSKKISKFRVTGLWEGNSPVTGEFPAQRASSRTVENASIWWRHHGQAITCSSICQEHFGLTTAYENSLFCRMTNVHPNKTKWCSPGTQFILSYHISFLTSLAQRQYYMMTSSNGNIFRVTGHLWVIHRSPVNSPHKGQWRGALIFSLICVWINGWVNNREAGDLRRYPAHYDVTVMIIVQVLVKTPWYGCINSSPTRSKWPLFRRRYFQMHLREWKYFCVLVKIPLKFVPKRPIDDKPALVQIMAWCLIHYLNQCWLSSLTHICGSWGRGVYWSHTPTIWTHIPVKPLI